MAKQMELFEDGGLKDEGGTIDPISGNDVPPGSTQKEVRDDIPAQLSEGEFVFPADVVRFIGLEKLMKIRQRAKAGLQRMEDMGQMGNSEEAIMPDDLPFSIDDLDMEDDGLEMNQGGVVSMSNGGQPPIGINPPGLPNQPVSNPNIVYAPPAPTTTGTTGVQTYTPPSIPGVNVQGVQATQPNVAFQTTTSGTNIPDFDQYVGGRFGSYDEMKTYVDENGQNPMQILFKNGQPLTPIPAGYREAQEGEGFSPTPVTTTPTTGTGVQTTQVSDDGDGGGFDDDARNQTGRSIQLGGSRTGIKGGLGIPGTKYAGPSELLTGTTKFGVNQYGGISIAERVNKQGIIGGILGKAASSIFGSTGEQPGFGLVRADGTEIFLTPEQFANLNRDAESRMNPSGMANQRTVESRNKTVEVTNSQGLKETVPVDIYGIPVLSGIDGINQRMEDKAKGDAIFAQADRDRGLIDTLGNKGLGKEDFLMQDIEELGRVAREYGIDDLNAAIDKMAEEFGKGYEDEVDDFVPSAPPSAPSGSAAPAPASQISGRSSTDPALPDYSNPLSEGGDDGGVGGDFSGIGDAGQGGPGGYGESYAGIFNKGGLASQMKRSGLASKK
tara:strand:- start:57 stop:1886 length:1830 start_codon:yes stop_codon:yes gene_type:complete